MNSRLQNMSHSEICLNKFSNSILPTFLNWLKIPLDFILPSTELIGQYRRFRFRFIHRMKVKQSAFNRHPQLFCWIVVIAGLMPTIQSKKLIFKKKEPYEIPHPNEPKSKYWLTWFNWNLCPGSLSLFTVWRRICLNIKFLALAQLFSRWCWNSKDQNSYICSYMCMKASRQQPYGWLEPSSK